MKMKGVVDVDQLYKKSAEIRALITQMDTIFPNNKGEHIDTCITAGLYNAYLEGFWAGEARGKKEG